MDQMLSKLQPVALSLFRFITGLLLFQFGVAKLLKFPPGTMFEKVELFSLIGAAGALELVLGGLLMIGLFSRIVAFILAGEMAFAYFIGHFPKGFYPLLNNGSLAIAFCFACLYLATSGPGPISVDAAMGKR
ncbi:DoxX family protein [Bradyrhizobium elkanii]|uniref:DoxX family protein n=1 Tax=Bradyrhizobium elkanii TaxID=29448 RepID=UPI000841C2BA|nr:DoxX family protein [Bradyrhizobium elkanii]ODM74503.1 LuxR family transcriptional regulator [Bradyrhizobium elkanii]ODM75625.1 LuxR family transcriptional regulator [Bradyrhizobium elkanii]